jgi:hypothetical protein
LKKNKLILSGLFLTSAISCSAYRPIVLNAYLNPESTTEVSYDDINWSYALFNQYASGLSYTFRLNYSAITPADYPLVNSSIRFVNAGLPTIFFQAWDIQTTTYSEAKLNAANTQRLNQIFFDRDFNRTTKKAAYNSFLTLYRYAAFDVVNFEIIIDSRISYRVNVGSAFMAFENNYFGGGVNNFYNYIDFYNTRDELLQTYLLTTDITNTIRNYKYDLSTILTNVNRFRLKFQWVDVPPFATSDTFIYITEFNLFTQGQEINIPDEAEGNLFGFEFVAVEWWDILGHLQNFAWWIVNQSPLRPLFEWLDTYIISWIRSFIDILTGVFNL